MEETQISAAPVLDKLNMLLQFALTFYAGLAFGDVEDADCVCVVQPEVPLEGTCGKLAS